MDSLCKDERDRLERSEGAEPRPTGSSQHKCWKGEARGQQRESRCIYETNAHKPVPGKPTSTFTGVLL